MKNFEEWWNNIGYLINFDESSSYDYQMEVVAKAAWDASSKDPSNKVVEDRCSSCKTKDFCSCYQCEVNKYRIK